MGASPGSSLCSQAGVQVYRQHARKRSGGERNVDLPRPASVFGISPGQRQDPEAGQQHSDSPPAFDEPRWVRTGSRRGRWL
ncbi:hypothetical protein E2320_007891 [Naja naja]|nr:hypothetical protein E2320_007891 [Naja naja]